MFYQRFFLKLLIVLNLSLFINCLYSQDLIETVPSTNALKLDFKCSLKNLLTMANMSPQEFKKNCEQIGFTATMSNNWDIEAYAFSTETSFTKGSCIVNKSSSVLYLFWRGANEYTAFEELLKDLDPYYKEEKDGHKIYGFKKDNIIYQFHLKRTVENNMAHESVHVFIKK